MDEGEISHEELQKLTLEECREQSDNMVKILQADEEAMDEAPTFSAKEEGGISDEERQTSTPHKLSSADKDLKEGEIKDETVQKFAPQKLSSADQVLLQNVKDILDSLTPLNIQLKMLKLEALQIKKKDVLQELVNLLLEKAFDQPQLIAQLVKKMNTSYMVRDRETPELDGSPLCRTIRKLILRKILKSDEKIKTDQLGSGNVEICGTPDSSNEENEEKLKLMLDEEKKRKLSREYMGLFRFLAELYKYDLAKLINIRDCITYLLSQEAEEPLECLCLLLSSIGEKLERELAKEEFNELFTKIGHKTQDSKVSYRIKNMLQEVVALRQMKWLNIRDSLNGLTHKNVFLVARKLIHHPINKEEFSQELVNQIFEMSIDDPAVIAKLCGRLETTIKSSEMRKSLISPRRLRLTRISPAETLNKPKYPETIKFRELFLSKCQQSIEKYNNNELNIANRAKEIEETRDQEKKKNLKLMLDEDKRKFLNLVKFMGKLYISDLASSKTMCDCVTILLSQEAEDPIKCLCYLLMNIGKKLELELAKELKQQEFDEYFAKLSRKSQDSKVSSELQNLLQDVMELRRKEWKKNPDEILRQESSFTSSPLCPQGSNQDSDGRQTSGYKYRTGSSSYTHTVESSRLRNFQHQYQSDAGAASLSMGGVDDFNLRTGCSKRPPSRQVGTNRFALLEQAGSSQSGMKYSSSRGGMGRRVSGPSMSLKERLGAASERNDSLRWTECGFSSRRNSRPRYMPGHPSASFEDAVRFVPPPSSAFMNFSDILNFSRPS